MNRESSRRRPADRRAAGPFAGNSSRASLERGENAPYSSTGSPGRAVGCQEARGAGGRSLRASVLGEFGRRHSPGGLKTDPMPQAFLTPRSRRPKSLAIPGRSCGPAVMPAVWAPPGRKVIVKQWAGRWLPEFAPISPPGSPGGPGPFAGAQPTGALVPEQARPTFEPGEETTADSEPRRDTQGAGPRTAQSRAPVPAATVPPLAPNITGSYGAGMGEQNTRGPTAGPAMQARDYIVPDLCRRRGGKVTARISFGGRNPDRPKMWPPGDTSRPPVRRFEPAVS